ncbi:MAG: hypothetical protein Q8Q89_04570 [bacterium]|nr:hypothetical protein [bacterium]
MRNTRITLLFLTFFVFSNFANAQELMPLEEVERLIESSPNKEVKAYFHSVERGTQIKRYDIVLRGVLKESGFNIVMFVTSNKIVAGMSGSPVYVGDKLVGALAYGFNGLAFSDWRWGGITPIHSMIEQAESGRQRLERGRTFNYEGMRFEPIPVGNQTIPGSGSLVGGKFIVTSSLASQRVLTGTSGTKPVLKAGMPIVVDLIEWTNEKGKSSTVNAMGTITYIDNNGRIYAFGHPYLDSRNVVYGFRTAEVMGTVYSESDSYKLTGKTSEVLGVITHDASYGISGSVSLDELKKLNYFKLEFKAEGKPLHSFDIKVADSILTPLLAQAAFSMIGEIYEAPLPQETSVTQIDSKVGLEGHGPILWKELFSSTSTRFGAQTLYKSSYQVAYEAFFAGVYGQLFENNYGLKLADVSISVDFIPGKSRTFKIGAYKFPSKVIYGQDPTLEIVLVDENNYLSIAKKVKVQVDWDKVEKPIYAKDALDTDKVAEKRVNGSLGIYSSGWFFQVINQRGGEERQKLNPDYFLGVDDFLKNFSRLLEATNQKIFLMVVLKSKSGLFDKKIEATKELIPQGIPENGSSGWHVIAGGLANRVETVTDEGSVVVYPELPKIPDGYVVDRNLHDGLFFEIVNE